MVDTVAPWLPFLLAFVGLGIAYRTVTFVTLGFFYRLTHRPAMALYLYALFVWPGTVVHELSHWLAAGVLRVRATLPHLLPGRLDRHGRMVLGHVRVEQTDFIRRSLIGVAPFLAGCAVVGGLARFLFVPTTGIEARGFASVVAMLSALPSLLSTVEGWLCVYLLFAVANGMMPSASDREAWPALAALVALLLPLLLLIGMRPLVAPVANWGLQLSSWLTFAFTVTIVLDVALLLVLWPLERALWALGR